MIEGMVEKDKIRGAVLRAIEQANELSVDGNSIPPGDSHILLGEGSELDSMGFVNFVVALEEELNRLIARPTDVLEKFNAAAARGQPISTVGQLIDFLYSEVQP
jgi:acyl carrier protein